MPDYANGKVYAVRSRSREDLVYIGSTTQPLAKRYSEHMRAIGKHGTSAKQVIDIGDSYVELIEAFPCANKDELLRREGQIIRSMDCVNRCVAGRTLVEYRADNAEAIAAYAKQWNQKNIEHQKQKHADYQSAHAEAIRGWRLTPCKCECGVTVSNGNMAAHRHSKKHLAHISLLRLTSVAETQPLPPLAENPTLE